jgi:hypothetical protein
MTVDAKDLLLGKVKSRATRENIVEERDKRPSRAEEKNGTKPYREIQIDDIAPITRQKYELFPFLPTSYDSTTLLLFIL